MSLADLQNADSSGGGTSRRSLLRWGALGAFGYALGGGPLLSRAFGGEQGGQPAKALIVIWLDGGPSQLETFDPHPGGKIGGPTKAVATKQKGISFADGLPRLAERADRLTVIRSLVTKEGEHQRGRYLMRTGYPLIPTVSHPALTAAVAYEADHRGLEIPAHVSFLSRQPPLGGYLGVAHDAFRVGDPRRPVPDLTAAVGTKRFERRLADLERMDKAFLGRRRAGRARHQHRELTGRAREMMESKQVNAFKISEEPKAVLESYGDTAFGRACLAARRLVQQGVPAVEVTLSGWDTHADHFDLTKPTTETLDRGFSALLDDLKARDLLASTLVVCMGEFGRTPRINPLDGRDHWTRGFSVALAGGGLRVGQTIGSTDPNGTQAPTSPVKAADLLATIYSRLDVDYRQWFDTPQGRPIRLCDGKPIPALLRA
ncbi:MAG: DUF1501 domain-containing protein [Planctomycetes bacterium]|nr:DUF1501 domain-containing protein [Planctomycetota bacterium]